jgi:hypothetical protein
VARLGARFDAQGVLVGSKDSGRCIRYLTKYLTKHIAGCHTADTPAQEQHAARLLDALRYERARRRAETGCGTASSPRTPARTCGPAGRCSRTSTYRPVMY